MKSVFRPGIATSQGSRGHMEDRHIYIEDLESLREIVPDDRRFIWTFYGVFDGHGGELCSTWAADNMHINFITQDCFPEDIPKALELAVLETDQEFMEKYPKLLDDGCTAIVIVMKSHKDTRITEELWICNCGDSRAALVTYDGETYNGTALSIDHKPARPDEKKRIEAAGGVVKQSSIFGIKGPYRVYDSKHRGGLAVSRALGDAFLKRDNLVISNPEIVHIALQTDSVGFILASDGLWDEMSTELVAKAVGVGVASKKTTQEIAEALVSQALSYSKSSLAGSDNITVIFCKTNPKKTNEN